jgi:hypothetical protein
VRNAIRAARREARRRAETNGTPLQRHLDSIAREAGRRHWADFLSNPVDIVRNPLDRLVGEAVEDGYGGLEIEMGDHLPAEVAPILVKAFRTDEAGLRLDLFRLAWDDALHLAPAIRKRFERPNNNAAHDVDCGGHHVFLYNNMDFLLAFHVGDEPGWMDVHDMDPQKALAHAGRAIGWWRGREGRSIDEVAADVALHDAHVRKLATVLATPAAPPVRYDPFCSTEVSSRPEPLVRSHFDAVARLVIPDAPDAHVERIAFTEIALRIRGGNIHLGWGSRSAGLRDMADLARPAWQTIMDGPRPAALTGMSVPSLTSAVNRLATRMLRFRNGALAEAVDGQGERFRRERAYMEWEDEVSRAFARKHPEKGTGSPEHLAWIEDARARTDAPMAPAKWSPPSTTGRGGSPCRQANVHVQ